MKEGKNRTKGRTGTSGLQDVGAGEEALDHTGPTPLPSPAPPGPTCIYYI